MKTWRTINSIAIEQCHRRHLMRGTHLHELLGNRSAFEKTECRMSVEFDVHKTSCQLSALLTAIALVIARIGKPMSAREIAINAIESHAVTISSSQHYIPFFAIP